MGDCLKLTVTCVVTCERTGVSVEATNQCNKVKEICWRVIAAKPSGEGYELCGSTHAERNAMMAFNQAGFDLVGATVRVYGHTFICDDCKRLLRLNRVGRVYLHGREVCLD